MVYFSGSVTILSSWIYCPLLDTQTWTSCREQARSIRIEFKRSDMTGVGFEILVGKAPRGPSSVRFFIVSFSGRWR